MTKLKQGILGPISGKIGPVIGGIWKNIPYLREAARPGSKKKKRSEAQIASSEKFKFINKWLEPFQPYVSIGFNVLAVHKTERNIAHTLNYDAVTGIHPNLNVDYSKVVISKGSLPMLFSPQISMASATEVKLDWQQIIHPRSKYNDQVMLMLYCPEIGYADGFTGGVNRALKTTTFKFHPKLAGKLLHAYVSITSASRKMVANSQYLGALTPFTKTFNPIKR